MVQGFKGVRVSFYGKRTTPARFQETNRESTTPGKKVNETWQVSTNLSPFHENWIAGMPLKIPAVSAKISPLLPLAAKVRRIIGYFEPFITHLY